MNIMRILVAGFGGQGVLFAGKFLASLGLLEGREVSWLPSYGPEMRGGTANCGVILSDLPVGSPIVSEPDVLIAMNLPSFQKYQPRVKSGGAIVYDSTLIPEAPERADVRYFALPATRLAAQAALAGLANMALAGKFLRECYAAPEELIERTLAEAAGQKRPDLLEANRRALAIGRAYEG
ncbi:MAG TPA: 2-oxoacid:acceptor oxidoreductase family protein [Clostridia bacterium]|nr:2-oxoacid:acceptor oxidoreductase family protein [Clostridia bacterium]HPK16041.1 2-oxoacid:acceptor oxidoreductase family protein [Clostridia bacterium]